MTSLTLGKFIGNGAYGSVYLGTWEGRRAAIKKVSLSQDEVRRAVAIQREVEMLQNLVDNHIIQFYGTAYHDGMLVLVMNYAEGGSLHNAIDDGRLVDWSIKARIAQEIVRGLAYIHHKGVLHRDLKSMNVLLTRSMEVKLCDFGLATVKTRSASKSSGTLKGTFRWMAPELFGARPKYSTKSDIYALAVVMWEMAANCTTPFKEQPDNFMVMALIKGGEREVLPDDTPTDYRGWVERCWDQDPDKRPDASEMIRNDEEPDFVGGTRRYMSMVSISTELSGLTLGSSSSGSPESKQAAASPTLVESFDTLLARAERGHVEAQVAVAAMFEKGRDVAQNYSEAFKWYTRAAEQNSTEAEYKVGDLYYYGRGTAKNHELAVYWMRVAAEKGHTRAQNDLGWMYRNGYGVKQNYNLAMVWYRKSAEQGDASGQNNLGWMYQNGLGIERDYDMALSWYRRAAELGDVSAQNNLGWMYQNGLGVAKDYVESVSWYRKSAEQGNASAQNNLGFMCKNGLGVEQDHCEAVYWYRRSALQGNASGQNNLGLMYDNGLGVTQNYEEAVFWYRKSAEQGNSAAQFDLGLMYKNGQGVAKDTKIALEWFQKSAKQGDKDAEHQIRLLS